MLRRWSCLRSHVENLPPGCREKKLKFERSTQPSFGRVNLSSRKRIHIPPKGKKRKTHRLKTAGRLVGGYVIIPRKVSSCFLFIRYVRFVEGNLKSVAWGWFVEIFMFTCFMKLRKVSSTQWTNSIKSQTECDKSQTMFSSWEYITSYSVHVTNYSTLHYVA